MITESEEPPIAVLTDSRAGEDAVASRTRGSGEPRAAVTAALAASLLWLLVGPRIELPGLAGLRVEDLVLAATAMLCLLHLRRPLRPHAASWAVAGVVVAGAVSAVVASARGMVDPVTSLLYAVRPLEYWIAFPAVLVLLRSPLLRRDRIDLLLGAVTVLQSSFAIAQYYFFLPVGFSHAAYTRAAGLTVGPYELGAISAALVVYWAAHARWPLASLAAIALAASISRVSTLGAGLALGVLAMVWLVRRVRRGRSAHAAAPGRRAVLRRALDIASIMAALLVLAFTMGLISAPEPVPPAALPAGSPGPLEAATPVPSESGTTEEQEEADPAPAERPVAPSDTISQRLASTSIRGSWDASGVLAEAPPPIRTTWEYQTIAFAQLNQWTDLNATAAAGGEASNLVRFFRWHLILRTIDDPADVLLGLGPSFVGPSVDGSYLRIFAEGGILGMAAWAALAFTWLRRSPLWMVCVTIVLLVGATFIDIFFAERPMVLFWTLQAVAVARSTRLGAVGAAASPDQSASSPASR